MRCLRELKQLPYDGGAELEARGDCKETGVDTYMNFQLVR